MKFNVKAAAVPPKLQEIGKILVKHGTDAIRGDSAYEKMLKDDRIRDLVKPPFKIEPEQAIKELPHDVHVRYDYLQTLLSRVHEKAQVQTIIGYIKSAAADNLTADQRAHLLISALQKLRYLDIISQFLS